MQPAPEFLTQEAHPGETPNPESVKPTSIPDDVWIAVRNDYRSGLTYSKLSEKFGIPVPDLVKKRREQGWTRDLREEVRVETFARLAGGSVPLGSPAGEEEIIQAAATRGVAVVERHRDVLKGTIESCQILAGQLQQALKDVAAERPPTNLDFLGAKETLADAALKIANALARTIPLERIAYGLNEKQEEKPYEERLKEFYAQQRAKRAQLATQRKAEARK